MHPRTGSRFGDAYGRYLSTRDRREGTLRGLGYEYDPDGDSDCNWKPTRPGRRESENLARGFVPHEDDSGATVRPWCLKCGRLDFRWPARGHTRSKREYCDEVARLGEVLISEDAAAVFDTTAARERTAQVDGDRSTNGKERLPIAMGLWWGLWSPDSGQQ